MKDNYKTGSHSIYIVSIIFGSMLGNGYGKQKGLNRVESRFTFQQASVHVTYLLWLHRLIAEAGYCKPNKPAITTRLGKKGVVVRYVKLSTFYYSSFNWIYDLWYKEGVKVVPQCISDYLTPLALAIWIMDSGVKASGGLVLCRSMARGIEYSSSGDPRPAEGKTNYFSYSDCLLLVQALDKNFGVKATIQSTGVPSQYRIYIPKEYVAELREIVSPFILREMKYKLLP